MRDLKTYLSVAPVISTLWFGSLAGLLIEINSPGGWVIPGVAIYDTMQFVQPDVQTVCMGLAASMGSFILVGEKITKRIAFPHA